MHDYKDIHKRKYLKWSSYGTFGLAIHYKWMISGSKNDHSFFKNFLFEKINSTKNIYIEDFSMLLGKNYLNKFEYHLTMIYWNFQWSKSSVFWLCFKAALYIAVFFKKVDAHMKLTKELYSEKASLLGAKL